MTIGCFPILRIKFLLDDGYCNALDETMKSVSWAEMWGLELMTIRLSYFVLST